MTKKISTESLIKKIKARQVLRPRVLFMTGFSDVLNEQIYHYGAEGKFTKPFNLAAVRAAIQTCLLAPEAKWGQVVGNLVSEWTQTLGLVLLSKRFFERQSGEKK